MTTKLNPANVERLLVVMPTWVGDAVMATPALIALRQLFFNARIVALARPGAGPIIDHHPAIDEILAIASDEDRSIGGMLKLARRLKKQNFNAAVILPNSFRSAMLIRLTGIPSRIGINRDGRGWLLTDKVQDTQPGEYDGPEPTIDHYLRLVKHLGVDQPDRAMQLATSPDDDARGQKVLLDAGWNPDEERKIAIINAGANYGDAKIWPAERFADVATRLADELSMLPVITGSPKERAIIDEVLNHAKTKILDLPAHGLDLHSLKAIVKCADLMVTNDTGPRHIAAAFEIPLVTIFGPTDPRLTTIGFALERELRVDVPCSPCQKKSCPLTGTADELCCMRQLTADTVFQAAKELIVSQK